MYNLTTGEIGMNNSYGTVRDSPWGWEWAWNGTANEWRLTVYSEFGATCGPIDVIPSTFTGTLTDLFGAARTNCKQFLLDAYTALASVVGSVGSTTTVTCPSSFFGSSYTGSAGTCYRIVVSKTAMRSYLASKVDKFSTWASETPTKSTTNYNPSYSSQGFASQAAQNSAFTGVFDAAAAASPGEFVDYALNPSGTVSNPLIDFAMPGCWGLGVSECEDAITDVADAVGQTVSFNVTTAPADDPDIARDLVLSTFPAVSAMARPNVVDLVKNSSLADQKSCGTTTDNPHWSPAASSVVAKGNILCNYTGTALYQMTLWECDDSPLADDEDLGNGAWGCTIAYQHPVETPRSVVAGVVSVVNCPPVGEPTISADYDTYWIAQTLLQNASPIINASPNPSWSQEGWQLPQ